MLLENFKLFIKYVYKWQVKLKTFFILSIIRFRFPWLKIGLGFISYGIPKIHVGINSKMHIGKNCTLINSTKHNPIGIFKPCTIFAVHNGIIQIGDNVGMSGVSICSYKNITIGNNVIIGANTMIFDTDFHSVNYIERRNNLQINNNQSIIIDDDVFIGANCIICKGVSIGRGSIVGAGSVVRKNIPEFEIWSGNPAKFIRNLNN